MGAWGNSVFAFEERANGISLIILEIFHNFDEGNNNFISKKVLPDLSLVFTTCNHELDGFFRFREVYNTCSKNFVLKKKPLEFFSKIYKQNKKSLE